jgi:hypothetical protein
MSDRGHHLSGSTRIRLALQNQWAGLISLFLVLSGGTAYALNGSNTVFSDDIVNGEVQNADLGANSVGTGKVVDGTLVGADVKDNSVTGTDVADNSLGSADIAGLTGADVADNTLGSEDVRQEGLRGEDIDEATLDLDYEQVSSTGTWDSAAAKSHTVYCPTGTALITGGGFITTYQEGFTPAAITGILPKTDSAPHRVTVYAEETESGWTTNWKITATAICTQFGS